MESVEIVKALRSLGLGRGDIVLLHSSLISLGYVEGARMPSSRRFWM